MRFRSILGVMFLAASVVGLSWYAVTAVSRLGDTLSDAYACEWVSVAIADYVQEHKALPQDWTDIEPAFRRRWPNEVAHWPHLPARVYVDFALDMNAVDVSHPGAREQFVMCRSRGGATLRAPDPNGRIWDAIRRVRMNGVGDGL